MNWIDKSVQPLPQHGRVIVSVTRRWGEAEQKAPACFTDVVQCDEGDPIGQDGDSYLYRDEITHWQPLPAPVVATYEYN